MNEQRLDRIVNHFRVPVGKKIDLQDWDPNDTLGLSNKKEALAQLKKNIRRLSELQYLLYADHTQSLLLVLQGLDSSGKDGAIRHVLSGINPQGCRITSFKAPSEEERDHGYLWRIHKAVPRKGEIGIFNRSQYEDVLIVRVHNLVPKQRWSKRYDQINQFEKYLSMNGVKILKFYLHISKDEQKKRLQRRLKDPAKRWKFNPQDLEERKFWPDYVKAYKEVLSRCNKSYAPWFVVPANKKWFRNLVISHCLVEALEQMKLQIPTPKYDLSKVTFT